MLIEAVARSSVLVFSWVGVEGDPFQIDLASWSVGICYHHIWKVFSHDLLKYFFSPAIYSHAGAPVVCMAETFVIVPLLPHWPHCSYPVSLLSHSVEKLYSSFLKFTDFHLLSPPFEIEFSQWVFNFFSCVFQFSDFHLLLLFFFFFFFCSFCFFAETY